MAVMEAGAMARPVVATDVGGVREAVLEGRTGRVVPRKNPVAMAEAIGAMLSLGREERRRWGEAGRKHVHETFRLELAADRHERLYRRLTS